MSVTRSLSASRSAGRTPGVPRAWALCRYTRREQSSGWSAGVPVVVQCRFGLYRVCPVCGNGIAAHASFGTNFESGSANANAEGSSVDCAAQVLVFQRFASCHRPLSAHTLGPEPDHSLPTHPGQRGPVKTARAQRPPSKYSNCMVLVSNKGQLGCFLPTDAPSELDILGQDGDALGVDGTQVCILKQIYEVCLCRLLQSQDCRCLIAVAFTYNSRSCLSDLTNKPLTPLHLTSVVLHILCKASPCLHVWLLFALTQTLIPSLGMSQ